MRAALPACSLAALTALLAACTSTPEPTEAKPEYAEVTCPSDVELLVVPAHTCGEVVIEQAAGPEVRLFTLTVEPPAPSDLEPILETGTDLGVTPSYGGLAPIAQRTGRRLVIVDLRGTGHSTPSLDCPEIDTLAAAPGDRVDADSRAVVDAVGACRARLESQGLDLSRFDVDGAAADLHAVAQAMGVPQWVAMGHGTTGAVAVSWARTHPGDVAALVLDSPQLVLDDQDDSALDAIVVAVSRLCVVDESCAGRYGDVEAQWQIARRELAASSLPVVVDDAQISVDDAELARVARWVTAVSGLGAGGIPALALEASSRQPGAILEGYATTVLSSSPLCPGYLPRCNGAGAPDIAMGAVLAATCPTLAGDTAWLRPCGAWGGSAPATPQPVRPLQTPALVLLGQFDAFALPEDVRPALRDLLPDAYVVEDPAGGHNVLGQDCMRSIRSGWLAGPLTDPPPDLPCLDERRLVFH